MSTLNYLLRRGRRVCKQGIRRIWRLVFGTFVDAFALASVPNAMVSFSGCLLLLMLWWVRNVEQWEMAPSPSTYVDVGDAPRIKLELAYD